VSSPVVARLAAAAATTAALFVAVAARVAAGWSRLANIDERWAAKAYAFTVDHRWCEALARTATWLADGVVVTVVTSLGVALCLVRRRRLLGLWLAVTVAGSALLNSVVKAGVQQARPSTAGDLTPAHGFAFPSGHTQAATVTYVALVLVVGWRLFAPRAGVSRASAVAVAVLVGAVGLSRVMLGAHWPSDVLGGWLLGSAWVTAATALLLTRPPTPADRP
jgi:undecaprenyl-diphosphatase